MNQSPLASRFTRGSKWTSRSTGECSWEIFRRDSTALSLTTVSSTVARLSRGGCRSKIGDHLLSVPLIKQAMPILLLSLLSYDRPIERLWGAKGAMVGEADG